VSDTATHGSDGRWQLQHRDIYDRGKGAVLLLFNAARGSVVLTRRHALVMVKPQREAPAKLGNYTGVCTRSRSAARRRR
jgi:hypothetical protein